MYDILLAAVAALVAGAAIKHVDCIEDSKGGEGNVKWPLAIVAGLCIGYVLAFSPAAVLFIGVIAAQVLMGKIDRAVHGTAVIIAAAVPLLLGMQYGEMGLLLPFFALAALDEVDFREALKPFSDYRLWLKAGALVAGALTGVWDYFVVLLAFDAAYLAVDRYSNGKMLGM
ncbi:hypothetical protein JW721_03350 [Candidatus Micrarchaeota archaeon]|nr:hypothetical protein [Candidatus Micrarchaeota archaeon]